MGIRLTSKINQQAKQEARQKLKEKGIRIFLMYILYSGLDLLMIVLAGWRIYRDVKSLQEQWFFIPIWILVAFVICALLNASVNLASLDIMRNNNKNFPVMLEPLRLFFNVPLMISVFKTLVARALMKAGWNIVYNLCGGIAKIIIAIVMPSIADIGTTIAELFEERKQIAYSQAIYIQRDACMDGQSVFGASAVKNSEELMDGLKLSYWVFQLSFLLYFVPSLILLGLGFWLTAHSLLIIGAIVVLLTAIYVWPYMQLAEAGYYQFLVQDSNDDEDRSIEKNMPSLETNNKLSNKQNDALDKYYGLK